VAPVGTGSPYSRVTRWFTELPPSSSAHHHPFAAPRSSYVPTCLPFRRFASTRTLTISLRAIHDHFACRFAHFHRFPAFFRSLSALGDPSSLKLSSAGQWVPKDFIAALLAPRNVHEICIHVYIIERKTMPFISR